MSTSLSLRRHGRTLHGAALFVWAVAGAACGGKVVSLDDKTENDVSPPEASAPAASTSSPPASQPVAPAPSDPSLASVAANCGNANVVYADVVNATGTGVMGGSRLFPVTTAHSSAEGMSTVSVELSTFGGEGPNGIAVMIGSASTAATPLVAESYAEPSDDSSGAPFLAVVIDGQDLMAEGRASGTFVITALAGHSSQGVLLPFSVAFDVTIATAAGPARVVGCGNWNG